LTIYPSEFISDSKQIKQLTNETMKKLLLFAALLVSALSFSQVGIGTTTPDDSAQLDVTSTTKGLLPPRLTYAQKTAISSPAAGLIVWCTNCGTNGEAQVFNGTTWTNISGTTASFGNPGAPTSPVATASNLQASVAFSAPASNGGTVITGYTVTSSPGSFTATGTSPIVVTGLTNGTSYTFTVTATNVVGTSEASAASVAVAPNCSANVGGTTKVFMCYNLGVTSTYDALTYQSGSNNGALYQWGRQTDGHEVRTSLTQAGPVAAPVESKFITVGSNDWISPQNNYLWLDSNGLKTAIDPCPVGFRVPTQAQWGGLFRIGTSRGAPNTATQNTWTWTGYGYTVGSNLFLPAAGYRILWDATLSNVGRSGFYWGSSVNGTSAYNLAFFFDAVLPGDLNERGYGFSVRCISE
jgi:uncharacterized protein (TIGR02145 family)